MSLFGSITILNKLPRAKKVGGVLIDGLLEETHYRKSQVTKLPVEDGSQISDHIVNEPDSVRIKGTISNTPLLYTTLQSNFAEGNVFGDRVTEAFEALENLRTEKKEVDVVTILKLYEGMVIEDFTPVKDQTTGQSMDFTMTLTKINKVSNQVLLIDNSTIGGGEGDDLLAQSESGQGQTVGTTDSSSDTIASGISGNLEAYVQ